MLTISSLNKINHFAYFVIYGRQDHYDYECPAKLCD